MKNLIIWQTHSENIDENNNLNNNEHIDVTISHNIYMDINEEYMEKTRKEIFDIFSYKHEHNPQDSLIKIVDNFRNK